MADSAGEGKEGSGGPSEAEAGPSGERRPQLPSFWVPSLTPAAKATEIKKPVSGLCECLHSNRCVYVNTCFTMNCLSTILFETGYGYVWYSFGLHLLLS